MAKRLKPLREIKGGAGNYKAHYKGVYLGSFSNQVVIEHVFRAVEAYDAALLAKKAKKDELAKILENLPAQLEKGIYRRGRRFIVASPSYLGSFGSYEEALAARAAAPRSYTTKPNETAPFEERTLKLE